MDFLLTIVITILIFGILVFVHEFGHFIVALKSGVDVDEFAFGFGPSIFEKDWKGVRYRINILPFGGYVKMLGDMDGSSFRRYGVKKLSPEENMIVKDILGKKDLDKPDADYSEVIAYVRALKGKITDSEMLILEKYVADYFIPQHPKNFDNKSFSTRLAVLLAGVFMNFILGSILFYVLFAFTDYAVDLTRVGNPKFIGAEISQPPLIYQVYKEEYAEYEGSLILELEGKTVTSREQLDQLIKQNFNNTTSVKLQTSEGEVEAEMILSGEGLYTNLDEEVIDKVLLLNILEGSAAAEAGIEDGDVLISFDGEDLKSPDDLRLKLQEKKGSEVEVSIIDTEGQTRDIVLSLPNPSSKEDPILGATPLINSPYYENAIRVNYGKNKVFSGFLHSTNLIIYNITAMGEFVKDAFEEDSLKPVFSKVNSIVAVVDVTFYFVKANNFIGILNLTAMLSVVLAFMNVLPIPLFDGGHILFLFIEKIRGKKISTEIQNKIGQIFFILLIILTILIVFKDLLQFEWPQRIGERLLSIIK